MVQVKLIGTCREQEEQNDMSTGTRTTYHELLRLRTKQLIDNLLFGAYWQCNYYCRFALHIHVVSTTETEEHMRLEFTYRTTIPVIVL